MDKKTFLIGGIALVVVLMMYEFYKRSQNTIVTASGARLPLTSTAGQAAAIEGTVAGGLSAIIGALHSGNSTNGSVVSDPIYDYVPNILSPPNAFQQAAVFYPSDSSSSSPTNPSLDALNQSLTDNLDLMSTVGS